MLFSYFWCSVKNTDPLQRDVSIIFKFLILTSLHFSCFGFLTSSSSLHKATMPQGVCVCVCGYGVDPTSTWRPLTMIISIKGHLLYSKRNLQKTRAKEMGVDKGRGEDRKKKSRQAAEERRKRWVWGRWRMRKGNVHRGEKNKDE